MMMPVATAQIAITTTNSNNNNQQQGPVYIKRPQQQLQGQKLQTQSFGESTDGFVDGPFPSGSTLNTLYSYRGNGKGIPGIFRTGREDNGQTSGALIFPTTNGVDSVDGPTGSNRNENENENESTNENGGAAGLLLQLQQYQEEKNNEEAGATMTSTTGSTTLITRPIATGTIPITTTTTAPATTTAATPATNTVTLTSANGNTLTEGSTAKLGNLRKRKGATTLTMTQSMVVLNQDEEKDEP